MTSKTWEEAAAVAARVVIDSPSFMRFDSLHDVDRALDDWQELRDVDFASLGAFALRDNSIWDVVDTIAVKQHDYGHQNILRHGLQGVVVRMCDKVERIRNLERRGDGNAVSDETVDATWLDLVGYSIIAIMLLNDTFTLPLQGDQAVQAPVVWIPQLYGDQSIGLLKHDEFLSVDLLVTNDGQVFQHQLNNSPGWTVVTTEDDNDLITWVEFYDDEEPF